MYYALLTKTAKANCKAQIIDCCVQNRLILGSTHFFLVYYLDMVKGVFTYRLGWHFHWKKIASAVMEKENIFGFYSSLPNKRTGPNKRTRWNFDKIK